MCVLYCSNILLRVLSNILKIIYFKSLFNDIKIDGYVKLYFHHCISFLTNFYVFLLWIYIIYPFHIYIYIYKLSSNSSICKMRLFDFKYLIKPFISFIATFIYSFFGCKFLVIPFTTSDNSLNNHITREKV